MVLPQTDAAGAALLAERMRRGHRGACTFRASAASGTLEVTASFGVASVPENGADRTS